MTLSFQADLLDRHLIALLGDIEPAAMDLLRTRLQWVSLVGGQTLMGQGEPGDSMYLVVSGRLRAYQRQDDGRDRAIREMGRGQVIGELSLFTDEPRSASIVAIRDSVLVRLDKPAFDELLARSPRLSMLMTRQIIHRLQNPQAPSGLARPVTMALLGITAGVDLARLRRGAAGLQLARLGRVAWSTPPVSTRRCSARHGQQRDAGQLDVDRAHRPAPGCGRSRT
jgi:NTE family protein